MSVRALLRHARNHPARRSSVAVAAVAVLVVTTAGTARAAVVPISVDTFTDTSGQHASQVEPDSFAFGSTVVTAVQTGRWFNGGASGIAVSRSGDGGATWTTTNLPNLTNNPSPDNPTPGIWDRVSDPVVTYDARHDVWMVSTLPLVGRSTTVGPTAAGVYTSRSTDGGITWGAPVFVTGSNLQSPDKNWIVCDNTATSPFYGRCYTEWDANGDGNRIYMSTSTDGGLTWGPRRRPSNNATGIGGQPVVQPNGTVIVPIDNANETTLRSFRSTNGGTSWSNATTITTISHHTVAGGLRTGPLPSAEIDASGRVFVAWQDCRFRAGCTANDIVFVTSTNGTTWSTVQRVPIDAVTSGRDHFIPGLAVDRTTSGATTRLALAYYFYPAASCTAATCQLSVGYVSSTNAGATWSAPTTLAGPMSLSWLPATTQGPMVGDYISTSFVGTRPVPVFVRAQAPAGSVLDQRMVAETGLATARAGAARSQSTPRSVVPGSGTARGAFVRR
ncbi:sialidase family protein [Kineosporia sp. R_H_3]|uniref:sialidase family protein n=1 Tax=Kineosporia sp. R_H_3 TaxID=1961848 RepID=UPI000B4B3EF5|nr:sialidase family protein [Kineosporia sp. R_H_3]